MTLIMGEMAALSMASISSSSTLVTVEQAKSHCLSLLNHSLPSLPPSKLSHSSKLTLHRLLSSELRFLSSSSSSHNLTSLNLGYLSSVLSTLLHPSLHHASRLCTPLPSTSPPLHVDIVCTFRLSPSWFFVSHRNPNYITFSDDNPRNIGSRLHKALSAARSAIALKPALIVLVFSKGVSNEVAGRLGAEFGAVEIDFGLVGGGRVFEVRVEGGGDLNEGRRVGGILRGLGVWDDGEVVGGEFGEWVKCLDEEGGEAVNFDTTALVAIVSGISNEGRERLLMLSESEMWFRFKSNVKFFITEVLHELEHPILEELKKVIAGKKGIICESVFSEFKQVVSRCGGRNEKKRAELLSKHLRVVPDNPSDRVVGLPTTRAVASKNKVVFGTGDYWRAPTLTANMGFVRAISQTGMSLFTIEHRPRALIGD